MRHEPLCAWLGFFGKYGWELIKSAATGAGYYVYVYTVCDRCKSSRRETRLRSNLSMNQNKL